MGTPGDSDQAAGADGVGVAVTQVTTCQWRSETPWLRYQCNQLVDSDHPTLCILHSPAEGKEPERFNQALRQKIEQEEADDTLTEINLAGVEFPADADFEDWVFQKAVTFAEAQFRGVADFRAAQFAETVRFWGTKFTGAADFRAAQFTEMVRFWRAQFTRAVRFRRARFGGVAVFMGTRFGGMASFEGARFGGVASFRAAHFERVASFGGARFSGEAVFESAQFGRAASFGDAEFAKVVAFSRAVVERSLSFQGKTFLTDAGRTSVNFHALTPESAQRVRFEGVDLSRVSFRNTAVSQVNFVGCTWAEKPAPMLWPLPLLRHRHTRTAIYDELLLDRPEHPEQVESARRLVAALYRQLRLNLEASLQEAEADQFYVGQMEMRRQDPTYPWLYRWMLGAYRVLAMYGESYLRPPFFYFLFGAVFALAYLWGGFQVGQAPVKYQWLDLDWGNTVPFLQDSVRAYVQALTAGGLVGTNLGGLSGANLESAPWWVPAVRYVNMLLDTFLVGFFVIALRRHFHR